MKQLESHRPHDSHAWLMVEPSTRLHIMFFDIMTVYNRGKSLAVLSNHELVECYEVGYGEKEGRISECVYDLVESLASTYRVTPSHFCSSNFCA